MTPSVASEKMPPRPPGRLGRAMRYAVLLLILMTMGSGPPSGQAQMPAGHAGTYNVFPRTFAPGQTVVIRSQTAFPPGALPTVTFAGVAATTVRTPPDRMALHVIVPGISLSGNLHLEWEAGRRADLGPFTLIGGGGGPVWIPCSGSPPTYEVVWSHLQSPAEVPVGTKVTAQVLFHDGAYTPGHWEGETPTPGVWPWTSKSFFPESGSIGRDGTKLYVRISGSHALDICDLALGETKVQTTQTGTFDAGGANGGDDDIKYTSDELGPPAYDYDPGDDDATPSTNFFMPLGFPWNPLIYFPRDEGKEDGEIHGEVSMDAPYDTYELLNYTRHKNRGITPTLCKGVVLVPARPSANSQMAVPKDIPLSLKILSIDCAENPVLARLVIHASDAAIAREDYDLYLEQGDEVIQITTWPHQTEEALWDNRGGGQGVHSGRGAASIKLWYNIRRNLLPVDQTIRPLSLSFAYIPTQGGMPNVSYRPFRMTHIQLAPVEVVDVKNRVLDDGDDVYVVPKATVLERNDKSIAWIEPHGSEDITNGPDMPQLALRLRGTETMGAKIKWKLMVNYNRPRGTNPNEQQIRNQDEVYIPKKPNGQKELPWMEEALDGVVEIFNHADWKTALVEKGFFGGEAELKFRLLNSTGATIGPETSMLFSIGGKNPDDHLVKQYIDPAARAADTRLERLSYAVAKHESQAYNGNGSLYNEFWEGYARRFRVDHRKGEPLWCLSTGESSAGGFGMYQITGNLTSQFAVIPREQFWNWRKNVEAYITIVKTGGSAAKGSVMDRFVEAVARTYPDDMEARTPPTTYAYEGGSYDAWEMGTITLYNGAGGCPRSRLKNAAGKWTQLINPWTFNPSGAVGRKWRYHANSNNYLREVIHQR